MGRETQDLFNCCTYSQLFPYKYFLISQNSFWTFRYVEHVEKVHCKKGLDFSRKYLPIYRTVQCWDPKLKGWRESKDLTFAW